MWRSLRLMFPSLQRPVFLRDVATHRFGLFFTRCKSKLQSSSLSQSGRLYIVFFVSLLTFLRNRQQYGPKIHRVRRLHPEPMAVHVPVSGIPSSSSLQKGSVSADDSILNPAMWNSVVSISLFCLEPSCGMYMRHMLGNGDPNPSVICSSFLVNCFCGRYDVALWATISDFPYSWPLWQRYSTKFVATQLVRPPCYSRSLAKLPTALIFLGALYGDIQGTSRLV